MSIVQLDLPEARVLDLFAGSGALGIEALSRGAAHAEFVENNPRSLATLRANLRSLDAEGAATIHRMDALSFAARLQPGAFDVAFADPPYRFGLAVRVAEIWLAAPFARVLGVEHEKTERMPGSGDRRAYGDTVVTLYRQP